MLTLKFVLFNNTLDKTKNDIKIGSLKMNISITRLPDFRYPYIAPVRINHTDNLHVYKCKVYTFVEI